MFSSPPTKSRFRWNFRSLRFRLTLFMVLLVGLTLIAYSAVIYNSFVSGQEDEFDVALYNYATDISNGIDVSFFGQIRLEKNALFNNPKIFPFVIGQSFFQIVNTRGEVLARSPSLLDNTLPIFPGDLTFASEVRFSFRSIKAPRFLSKDLRKTDYRLISFRLDRTTGSQLVLQIAAPMWVLTVQKRRLFRFFFIGTLLTLAGVALAGFSLAGQALAPVYQIINKAERIGASDLSERLPVPESRDELRDLSNSLNQLLDRLQQAFESQERFISDASHQLRTPLAILRGELDVYKTRERTEEEAKEIMASFSQELRHLSKVVDDLLILARVDAGVQTLEVGKVRMDEIVAESVQRLEYLANEKSTKIRFDLKLEDENMDDGFEIEGDHDLLRTMIQNLVENALKYSKTGHPVEVLLASSPEALSLQVRNWGPILNPEVKEKIFERFFQAKSGSRGIGLGLSIVYQIVQAHGGDVSVESSELSGTVFTVNFPRRQRPAHV